ncbi:DNA helicase RecG [Deltaproteobacteria bacterium Smac51]|nr:DNA helicase RecG [Deltaproteobacteria bacterium Smac51]
MLIWPNHPAFTTPLNSLKGVGPKTLARLNEEGFHTTGDLLALSPKFYQDRRHPKAINQLIPDEEALIEGRILSARAKFSPRTKRRYQEAVVEDMEGGRLAVTWFNLPSYYLKSLSKGRLVRLFGRVKHSGRGWEMVHPDMELGPLPIDDGELAASDAPDSYEPEIRPVYAPIGDLSSGVVKKLVDQALGLLDGCDEIFPPEWLAHNKLNDPIAALSTLHSPPGRVKGLLPRPSQTRAFQHLVFFELFFWRLMMLRTRAKVPSVPRSGSENGPEAADKFWRTLPFEASPEQRRVTLELMDDLRAERPMSRLLQGEVGGGKTAVAGAVLFFALGCGGQAALMAPTEVLARQHYDFLKKSGDALGFETALLTGSLGEKEKKSIRAGLSDGTIDLVVGSQALLSPATVFKNLSLAVIDEQHRFGVRQRLTLRRKNGRVDLLAMSATPIPRSLALMLYGDLDSSSLHGLLPGRTPAETEIFEAGDFPSAYARFLELVRQGGQGFLVTPRIGDELKEPADNEEPLRSLDDIYQDIKRLAGPDLPVGCLHGRMDAAEREAAMEEFRSGRRRILVATSIIEVGVDVPAARVIMIEGAERFGLAQLHQLRGRVGRGGTDGHCLLLPTRSTAASTARLQALVSESDGQALAELDLELRGPGEQLGLKQSGWPIMNYAALPRDLPALAKAHHLAEDVWHAVQTGSETWGAFFDKLDFEAFTERLMVAAEQAT